MDDEKPMELRDQLALSILNGLLSNSNNYHAEYVMKYLQEKDFQVAIDNTLEDLIRLSYRTADMMRKVRLSTFE